MLSFHNDQAVKDKYITRVHAHQEADRLIRGIGWKNGKGCAVGCTLENYDHSLYPVELGIPEWLAIVEDTLFEGMSLKKSKTWAEVFLKAVPLGVTEARFEREVKAPFLVIVLKSALENFDNAKFPDVTAAINRNISLWQRVDIGSEEFLKEAAWAAEAAAEAAGCTARAAEAAGWAAAEAAKMGYFADELIKLLEGLGEPAND